MGWFSKSKSKKSSSSSHPKPPKPSITSPPNVYTSRPPPQSSNDRARLQRPHAQPQQPSRPDPPPYSHQHAAQSQTQFQPAGYLPAPPGWTPPTAPAYQPVIVNQHYYLGGQGQQHHHHLAPPPVPHVPHHQNAAPGTSVPNLHPQQDHPIYSSQHQTTLGRLTGSMINLTKDLIPLSTIPQLYDEGLSAWHGCAQSTSAIYDDVYSRFNNVMTLIDNEKREGNESDLFNCHLDTATSPSGSHSSDLDRGGSSERRHKKSLKPKRSQAALNVATTVVSGNYFSKVEAYANSKLPVDLPDLALYMPTWPLLCLAAKYSQRVYERPTGAELDAHVSGDWLNGTKAMCIKSVPMDHMNAIVFAVRGTASFMDWTVNLNNTPVSPVGFLDDPGNHCHAGFLSVAKKMIKPVAARLRQLLQEDPSRARYSLLITGHSAGGAVAALLYSHMLAETSEARTDLNSMTGAFKRIHCVTFGAPPVSLLPLTKPDRPGLRKSLFLSFVNEGDPVVRADKAYVKSLLELLAAPPPVMVYTTSPSSSSSSKKDKSDKKSRSSKSGKSSKPSKSRTSSDLLPASRRPIWKVPPATLSNAGRIVVLRSGDAKAKVKNRKTVRERLEEGVIAVTCQDEQLRDVIWGDPVCHLMSLYAGRVKTLAVGAVTAER